MKKTKFKAWDKKNRKMIYAGLIWFDGDICEHWGNNEINYPMDWVLLEYTGLTDKKGKEIYEGDIIGYPNENVKSIVKFGEYKYNPDYETHENGVGFYLSFIKEDRIEGLTIDNYNKIIGNIYENPELLI